MPSSRMSTTLYIFSYGRKTKRSDHSATTTESVKNHVWGNKEKKTDAAKIFGTWATSTR